MCTGCGTVETVASIRRTHPTAFTCCPDRKMVRAIPDLGRWAGVSELVERITAEEGACVTFTGPNPDFNGLPNEVVSVCSSRTDWITEYFRADTLAGCLREALGETGA